MSLSSYIIDLIAKEQRTKYLLALFLRFEQRKRNTRFGLKERVCAIINFRQCNTLPTVMRRL